MTPRPILTQELLFSRSTKRTHVFEADDQDAHVRSLYVDKLAFNGAEAPRAITITITADTPA